MPQKDRFKDRLIPIEFDFFDCLGQLPVKERCSVVLITYGSATLRINGHFQAVTAPAVLCLSQYDTVTCIHSSELSAKSFHFDPWYIKSCLSFDCLDESIEIEEQYVYDRTMLYMFTRHHNSFQGIFHLTPQQYIRINELMLMIGAETYSQSDSFWTCRIRRMLRQLINWIYDIYVDQRKLKFFEQPECSNPATICADYIQLHYSSDLSLKDFCQLVNMNRTSLNAKFKAQFHCSCMEYLLQYRLKMSQELLANTTMKINEIAEACGFKYDSYFIRQFTNKLGISPSQYRKDPLSYTSFNGDKIQKINN